MDKERFTLRDVQHGLCLSVDAAICVNSLGKILASNEPACKQLLVGREELVGADIVDYMVMQHPPSTFAEELWPRCVEGAEVCPGLLRRSDGTVIHVELQAKRITLHEGEPEEVAVLRSLDTADKRRSEAKLRGVFDNSRSFIGLLSVDGILLDGNQTAFKAAGVIPESVLGQPFWETPWWSHSTEMQDRLKKAIATAASGTRDSFEATHPTPDGSLIVVDFSLSPIVSGGKVIYLVPEGRDITERRKREEERAHHLALLKETNEQLEQFAYVASHDLRSPLTGISQLAAFVREDEGERISAQSLDYLNRLEARVVRMQALLDDLLTYSRVGREASQPELVDVPKMIESIVELLTPPPGFQIEISKDLPRFHALATPLRQVFLNLIGNAIKHHDQAVGRIQVSAQELDEHFEFCIADDGPGIKPLFHEQIFGMFKTLASRDAKEGSGMGLAIIRKSVRKNGGDVWVESQPGHGSKFFFSWPKSPQARLKEVDSSVADGI